MNQPPFSLVGIEHDELDVREGLAVEVGRIVELGACGQDGAGDQEQSEGA